MANEPIAYQYDADHHCEDCARSVFGLDNYGDINGIDNEGNDVHALFSSDEWYNIGEGNQTLSCSDCGALLAEYTEEKTYSIYRIFRDPDKEREHILDGLSLKDAQEHCNDPSTSGEGWFDCYMAEE